MHHSVSVIVPCYNASKTLEACLKSVYLQSYKPKEIFVIDDKSKDSTVVEAKRLALIAPEGISVYLIELEKNSGPSIARNIGIAKSSSDYIALLDSDDSWLPNHLEVNLEVAKSFASDSFAIVHQPIDANEANLQGTSLQSSRKEDLKFSLFSVIYYLFIQKNCSTITLLASAKDVKATLFPEGRHYAEDFEFFIRLFSRVSTRAYLINPRTAVVGKHAWASGSGLSSQHFSMYLGVLKTLIRALSTTKYAPLLVVLLPWHTLKYFRRMAIFKIRS